MRKFPLHIPFLAVLCLYGAGCTTSQTVLAPPEPRLPDLAADAVIGQGGMTESGLNRVDALGLYLPSAVAIARTNSGTFMYIADQGNHRVVRRAFDTDGAPGEKADMVFGQPTFGSNYPPIDGATEHSLLSPAGLAVGADGTLAIADAGNNRVVIHHDPNDPNGGVTLLGVPATEGENTVSFRSPLAVTFDMEREHLWVADTGNNRVLRFTSNGGREPTADLVIGQVNFQDHLPNLGRAIPSRESLHQPTGLAIHGDRLVIADAGNNRVMIYTLTASGPEPAFTLGQGGRFDTSRRGRGAFGLFQPTSLCFDGEGHLVVSDTGNNRVLVFPPDISGEVRPTRLYGQPTGLGGGDGNTGGISANSLNGPVGVSSDPEGRLWIADTRNHRVLGYPAITGTPTAGHLVGQRSFSLAEPNSPDGSSLAEPRDVAVDFSTVPPRLYIADGANNRVLVFRDVNTALDGGLADLVIGPRDPHNTTAELIATPTSILPDGKGGVYITDRDNNRVLWFRDPLVQHEFPDAIIGSPYGAGTPSATTLHRPEGITRDNRGRLYIADTRNHRILRFSNPIDEPVADLVWGQNGNFEEGWINNGRQTAPNTLAFPFRMDFSHDGILAVADTVNHRVLLFDLESETPTEPIAVLGQGGDFNRGIDNHGGCGPTSLSGPEAVLFYHEGLLVADTANCRVLYFPNPLGDDKASKAWGQDGKMGACEITAAPPSATNFWFPTGLSKGPGESFLVTDRDHHRVLAFFP
ncbi:MAG: NHL repeat-containing protein [Candidatus Sumerlaeia bacterium]|nr:NHL repeat-containing protein [Candidatus Sumerlaeia bacterium]